MVCVCVCVSYSTHRHTQMTPSRAVQWHHSECKSSANTSAVRLGAMKLVEAKEYDYCGVLIKYVIRLACVAERRANLKGVYSHKVYAYQIERMPTEPRQRHVFSQSMM